MEEIRVVVAEPDANTRKSLRSILSQAGHMVVGEAEDSLTALKIIRIRQPDLVIMDAKMGIMDGAELANIIDEDGLGPVILLTQADQLRVSEQDEGLQFAFVTKPVSAHSLLPVMDVVLRNYKRIRVLEQEVSRLKDVIETRKLVEKAKGILMDKHGIAEAEAFKRIQKQSMNKRVSMKSVAKAILLAYELEQ